MFNLRFLSPPDPGLQAERTHLAWQRTVLALLLTMLLLVRCVYPAPGWVYLLVGGIGLGAMGLVRGESRRRGHVHMSFLDNLPMPGGFLPTCLTCMVVLLAATALVLAACGNLG